VIFFFDGEIFTLGGHQGKCAIVKGWDRLPSGKFGPVQTHGGIRLNDYVLRVNDQDLTTLPFNDVKYELNFTLHDKFHLSAMF
jgi:hypothetical protein